MRILGVTASGVLNVGDFELISTTILPSAQASVVFDVSSFASTYKHLQIRAVVRTSRASTVDSLRMRINEVSTTSYRSHYLRGFNSSLGSFDVGATTSFWIADVAGNSDVANNFSSSVTDILDPFSSSKNTTSRSLGGWVSSSERDVTLASGAYFSTDVVTSLTCISQAGSNLNAGSRFSLYGIKG